MIDVNKITSTLAKLPDAMLQKYAQLNKADPYIMALAMSESNRRKELRSAGQGGQGMQAQPKVVDKMVAEMAAVDPMGNVTGYAGGGYLPEDQGIGRLNAGSMDFADGGIVGYAGGGEVERYQTGGAIAAKYRQESEEMGMGMRRQYSPDVQAYAQMQAQPSPMSPGEQQLLKEEQQRMLAGGRFNAFPPLPTVDVQQPAAAAPTTLSGNPVAGAGQTPSPRDDSFRRQPDPRTLGVSATPPVKAAPTADTGRKAPGAGLGAAAAAAPKDDPFSMAAIRKAQTEAMGDSNYKIGALNNQLVDIKNKAETQMQQRLDERKKEVEAEGDVYKDRSDRIAERAKGLASQKNENAGLAILNAGLAIMSTPGGLMTAIGKGAQVGTAQYAAGIKDLRAAQERLDEANDRIAELRLNRKDLNSREIRALEKDRDNAILDGQKMIFGFAKDVYGMDRKQAEAAFTSYMSGQEKKATIDADRANTLIREGGANARSAAQIAATLNTPDRLVFNQLLEKNNNDAVKAAEALQKMKAEKFNMYEAYSKYLTGFAGKETTTPPENFDQFAARFTIPTTKAPGKGATVLKQP